MLSRNRNTQSNSVDTGVSGEQINRNVEDAVDDRSRATDESVHKLPSLSLSLSSLETSVENVAYERLEDNTTTSIPMQPSLRVFQGITEEATFEDGGDSDGEIGPFF